MKTYINWQWCAALLLAVFYITFMCIVTKPQPLVLQHDYVVVDGCEYIYITDGKTFSITHKGNCNNHERTSH